MMVRPNAEMGFVDAMLDAAGGPRTGELLQRLDAAVRWDELVAPILALSEYANPGPGRKPWDPEVMLKALLLAKWFNLSDPGLEEALRDRISFRRFVGLSFTDATPDETTFHGFRGRLLAAGLHEVLFDRVLEQIAAQGLLVREGTMVDATIVEQSRGRTRPDGTSTRDPEATHCPKHGRPHFGYKAHAAVDLSGVVTAVRFTTGSVHDSKMIDELTADETKRVIADTAYASAERRARLRVRGVGDLLMHKRVRGQRELYPWQEEANRLISKVRAKVEHPFGFVKQRMGFRQVRYRGLVKNAFDCTMTFAAYNIRRMLHLKRAQPA